MILFHLRVKVRTSRRHLQHRGRRSGRKVAGWRTDERYLRQGLAKRRERGTENRRSLSLTKRRGKLQLALRVSV